MINSLTDRNLLILTVYFICVAYVFYRAINSVQNKVKISLDQEYLNAQIAAQNLQNTISVQVKLLKEYAFDKLQQLPLSIENKSPGDTIFVDWDRSTLTDLEKRARRVIHVTPAMTLESQVLSVIGPGQVLRENFTAEDALTQVDDALKLSSPLFNVFKLKNGLPPQKQKYSDFVSKDIPLEFSLSLVLRRVTSFQGGVPLEGAAFYRTDSEGDTHILSCNFKMRKMPWTEAVSWKPKPK